MAPPLPVNPTGVTPLPSPATPQLGTAVPPTTQPPATPQQQEAIKNQWLELFERPETKAALLQFGVNLLQPRQPGDTAMGQVGRAFGAAGGAVRRVQETRKGAAVTKEKQEVEREKVAVGRERITSAEEIAGRRIISAEELSKAGIEADVELQEQAGAAASKRQQALINAKIKAEVIRTGSATDLVALKAFFAMKTAEAGLRPRGEVAQSAEELGVEARTFIAAMKEGKKRGPPKDEGVYNFLKAAAKGDARDAAIATVRASGGTPEQIEHALERLEKEEAGAVVEPTGREFGVKEGLRARAEEKEKLATSGLVKKLEGAVIDQALPSQLPKFSYRDRKVGLKALSDFMKAHPDKRETIEEFYANELEFWVD